MTKGEMKSSIDTKEFRDLPEGRTVMQLADEYCGACPAYTADEVRAQLATARAAVVELLNHIEDVVDDANWEKIDSALWNKVSCGTINWSASALATQAAHPERSEGTPTQDAPLQAVTYVADQVKKEIEAILASDAPLVSEQDERALSLFESILSNDQQAFQREGETVYQVTKSELLEFVASLAHSAQAAQGSDIAKHLRDAHAFIESTEAFGEMVAKGVILECGNARWDIDKSKAALAVAGARSLRLLGSKTMNETKQIPLTVDQFQDELMKVVGASFRAGTEEMARFYYKHVVQPGQKAGSEVLVDVEKAARAMAEHVGWKQWDTATDCCHTLDGSDPEDDRNYWRGLARVALSVAASLAPSAAQVQAVGEALDGYIGPYRAAKIYRGIKLEKGTKLYISENNH